MESVMIVSSYKSSDAFFIDILKQAGYSHIITCRSCSEARRYLAEQDVELTVINAPLPDETGERMAKHLAVNGSCQVLLVIKNEYYEAVTEQTQEYGVLTIAKPIHKSLFWSALHMVKASQKRIKMMYDENRMLNQKLQDIKMTDRAKCILIESAEMTESEAHKYIEKQAMDRRVSKRSIAEEIIKAYENDR